MGSTKFNRIRPVAQLASVLVLVVAMTLSVQLRNRPRSRPPQLPPASAKADPVAQVVVQTAALAPAPRTEVDHPQSPPPPVPKLDRAAVARAEAAVDEASRDRARAEARAAAAAGRLEAAANQAALDAAMARKLAFRIRDPSAQINRVAARGGFLRADLDKLKAEIAALRTVPRPKAASILTKSPVARPTAIDEFHFELHRDRVSFVNLDRLLDLAKADAQVRIRMSDRTGLINSQVGPVGSFSLSYVLGRANAGIDELIQRQSIRFDLKGWEIVPESEQRGETYEATRNPVSEYARAVHRLSPGRSVVTFWVYPDSFSLYRRLRAELVAGNFSVAGRPLPEGMTIRGSPMGSASAAQ
ncbi:MAG: hypothetical protein ACLQU5_35665 [Isosphaeraceae bacterium]